MTIGERIKFRREELGMSQEELAHKIGYKSRSAVNIKLVMLENCTKKRPGAIAPGFYIASD